MDDINSLEDDTGRPAKRDTALGGFFIVNFDCMRTLLASGATLDEFSGYLCLAVSSNRSNTISKAGKQSIRRLLGVSDRNAERILAGLIEKHAIDPLDDARRRGPGIARYRLMPIGLLDTMRDDSSLAGPGPRPTGGLEQSQDPRNNIIVPNTFVRPIGEASSPLQLIHAYGNLGMLSTAVRGLKVDDLLRLSSPATPRSVDGPRFGPLLLKSFVVPKFSDLAIDRDTEDYDGASPDVLGLLDLGLAEVRFAWERGESGSSAALPVAVMRDERLDFHAPIAPLSLLAFWLGHPRAREHRDGDALAAAEVINLWRTSETQFAAVPAAVAKGCVRASLHIDCANDTPRGNDDHGVYLNACERAAADFWDLIQRLRPDLSSFASVLMETAGLSPPISKRKRRKNNSKEKS